MFPLWPYQDSNLDLKFRKLPFYPLNYKAKLLCKVNAKNKNTILLCLKIPNILSS